MPAYSKSTFEHNETNLNEHSRTSMDNAHKSKDDASRGNEHWGNNTRTNEHKDEHTSKNENKRGNEKLINLTCGCTTRDR